MYKQIIIARKDLNMSPGKLAAQVSHASIAFLTNSLKDACPMEVWDAVEGKLVNLYSSEILIEANLYEEWICGSFTKCILEARNKNQLLKAATMAEALGMKEGEDYFLIKDNCYTELKPEEVDENGVGRTLTCIGFRPMDSKVIDQIGRKYQLYK